MFLVFLKAMISIPKLAPMGFSFNFMNYFNTPKKYASKIALIEALEFGTEYNHHLNGI